MLFLLFPLNNQLFIKSYMHSLKAFHSPNAYTKDNRAHGINRVGADHTTQLCNRSNNKNNKHVFKKKNAQSTSTRACPMQWSCPSLVVFFFGHANAAALSPGLLGVSLRHLAPSYSNMLVIEIRDILISFG